MVRATTRPWMEGGKQTYRVRRVGGLDALALKEEAHRAQRFALALAERRHEFLKLGAPLDFKEHLVVVVRDLDIEVFAAAARARWRLVLGRGAVFRVIGHVDLEESVWGVVKWLVASFCLAGDWGQR